MSQDIKPFRKRNFASYQPEADEKKSDNRAARKAKNNIFQKSQRGSKIRKKFSPTKSKRESWLARRLKRSTTAQPSTPHNTTQFIVDAVYYPTDPYLYEFDRDRLEHNFQHHAMAGSMMDLMQQKFPNYQEASQERCPMVEEKDDEESFEGVPTLRVVRSADDAEEIGNAIDHSNYDQYLKQAEGGKNLKDVIQHLVHMIRGKDDQINSLLSNQNQDQNQ